MFIFANVLTLTEVQISC